MVEAMDAAVGKVLDALDRLELAENTVVFFMSDNGGLSTSEGHPTSNLPLRAGKGWMYEGGIREPMIVRAPGRTKPGSECTNVVTSVDFFPTILELTGTDQAADGIDGVDGVSMVPLLDGESRKRGPIYWHYPHYGNQAAVRAEPCVTATGNSSNGTRTAASSCSIWPTISASRQTWPTGIQGGATGCTSC